ncbi:MAG TPA: DUF2946 family protein [Thermoanaerobaculia bacterium]|nr:DUF2946 family protein [Thermoanaerobaculia bacterium]
MTPYSKSEFRSEGSAYAVCSMRGTVRSLHVFVVLVALLLAAQPLLHNHPLDSGDSAKTSSATSCAVCATGAGRLPSATPSVAAPLTVLYTLATPALPEVATVASFARSSRAPPIV